jgi:hypothetical protein
MSVTANYKAVNRDRGLELPLFTENPGETVWKIETGAILEF